MPIVNRLPQISGEIVITCVAGGWKQRSGGNDTGISQVPYLNDEYWERDGLGIRAKKKFKAFVELTQGVTSDGGASDYRYIYNTSEHIMQIPTGAYTEGHMIYEFQEGEYIKVWNQLDTNNLLSICYLVILAF